MFLGSWLRLKSFFFHADLQDLLSTTSQGTEGKLSYEELQSLVGSTVHDSQSLKEFDADGDEKYSLSELRVALGI